MQTTATSFSITDISARRLSVLALALGFLMAPTPAMAMKSGPAITGMDSMHQQIRVGNRVCMASHTHTGRVENEPSKSVAKKEAIAVWVDYTVGEYGYAWGSWNKARAKNITCRDGHSGWTCMAVALPCRLR